MVHPKAHHLPPLGGGRSHHSDPWREGIETNCQWNSEGMDQPPI